MKKLPILLLALAFSARAAVYAPGLAQAKFTGASTDKTSDIAASSTLTYAAGPIMANTSGSAKDWDGTSWSWGNNTVFGYLGEMWMEAGTTYTFGKSVDDWTYIVVDGTTLIDNGTYNSFQKGSYSATMTGWVPIEIRVGNGGGGAGLSQGAKWGVAYNTVGDTTWDHFKAGSDGWAALVDPGDCSLLRVEYSNTDYVTIEGVAVDGNDLVVTASFTGLAGAGTLTAFYGAGDGETTPGDWDANAVAATPAAGDTASAQYRVAGAGSAAFVAFRLSAAVGTSTPIQQWSDTYALALASPAFKLVNTDVGYTNLSYTATCIGLGQGASSVDIDVELATDAAFSNVVQTKRLALAGLGSEAATFIGLTTNTTYYARVVGTNDQQESGASSTVSKTTLDPGFAVGAVSFAGRGLTTLSATGLVTGFGDGSAAADVRLEASTASDFATLASVSAEGAAALGAATSFVCEGLSPDTTYHLRLRIVNEWGLVTYVPVDGSCATRSVPIAATGIGYLFAADNSTVDFTFGVSEVFDGATSTATLSYGGRTFAEQSFSAAGALSWAAVPAAGGAATATVTVSSTIGNETYTQTWTATVTPGARSYTLSSLSDLRSKFFRVGDSAVLPELAGTGLYVAMDIRSFSLGEDGVTLTALEPGFSTVVSLEWNGETSSYAVADRALAVCIPEVRGAGRVFFAKPGAKMNWEDASKWTNVTDPSAEADYPHRMDDVAMVALPDNQLVLNSDATVAELYLGPDEDHRHSGGTQRLTGKNAATLTFARSSRKPGLLRFTGMFRIDTPALTSGFNRYAIGGGDGNSTSTGLGIEMPGGLEFDCGAWPDYTDTTLRDNYARARYWIDENMRHWNIPEGRTLRISNTCGKKLEGDSQDGNANFNWTSGSQVTGAGTFFYDAAASLRSQGMFRTFAGVVKVANKQAYDTFEPNDRGGGFKFRPEEYSSSSARVAKDATLLLEGDAKGSSVGSSFGVVNAGHTHFYGPWGRAINAYPAKRWILDGGYIYQTYVGSDSASWREDGTTATQTICTPNGAETLCVSNGLTYVKLNQSSTAAYPTNSLAFANLEHAGDGVLVVRSDRLFYSYNKSGWRDRTVLGGFHDHAIGGTGRAMCRHGDAAVRTNLLEATAPIVPWIVASVEADSNLYFPGADDDTDELVLAGHPAKTVLDQATDPTANVFVNGTTVALTADRTVNSLVVVNNRNAGKNLGAGRTLTITSGGLVMGNGNYKNTAYLGDESGYKNGTAGTLSFPNKAYVFVPVIRDDKNEHPEIWAKIVSPHGAVFSYPGDLHLGGDQTGIDDHIAVNGTDLRLGTSTTGCEIDVPVHLHGAFARLRIGKQGSFCRQDLYFWDHLTPGSKFEAAAGTEEVVHKMWIDGVSMPRGYYGSSASGVEALGDRTHPAFVDDRHFSGTGWIKVLTDEVLQPTLVILR